MRADAGVEAVNSELRDALAERDKLRQQLDKLQQHMIMQEEQHTEEVVNTDKKVARLEEEVRGRGVRELLDTGHSLLRGAALQFPPCDSHPPAHAFPPAPSWPRSGRGRSG